MAQVLIRDVDPEVVDRLKARALRNHRSLEAELRLIVTEAAEAPAIDLQTEVARVRALFTGRRFDDSTALLREDRER